MIRIIRTVRIETGRGRKRRSGNVSEVNDGDRIKFFVRAASRPLTSMDAEVVDASLEVWNVRIYLCVVLQSLRTCDSIMCMSELCLLVCVV